MFAGQTGRGGLRSRRLRIAVGVTAAATVIGMGGAFTAQAGAGNSAPAPEKVQQVRYSDVCEEPEPVDAVPVDAVPGKRELPKPGSSTDVTIDDKERIDVRTGGPIDAVPGDGDVCVEPDSYKDAKTLAPSKR
ncbi:hypothetical protein [Streptomyces phaeochromogenes]